MKLFTSRVVFYAFISVFACAQIASATTPEADFKTVTSKAYVDSLIDGVDISSHKVNGAPLSTTSIVFYGTSDAAAAAETRNVTMTNNTITTLETGMMVIVKPTTTATYGTDALANAAKMQINGVAATAKPMMYQGASLSKAVAKQVWRAGIPSIWVYDGTAWQFSGVGQYDNNTTYNPMTTEAGIDGTDGSTKYVLRPQQLKEIIQGTTLTGVTPGSGDVAATDSITTAIGKLQGAKQPIIAKSATAGVTELIAKPASTGTNGVIRTLTLDTSSLTADDVHVPSSLLVDNLKLNKSNVLSITGTGGAIAHGGVAIPAPLESWGADNRKEELDDGNQLFWVSYASENGDSDADKLIKKWDKDLIVPTMSEVSDALYGYWLTREKTKEWQDVAIYYRVKDASNLYTLGHLINRDDPTTIDLVKSAYLDTYAPTLSALMDEAVALTEYADNAANVAAGNVQSWAQTNRQITIPAAGSYYTSNSASGSPTAIYNSTSSTPNYTTASVKGSALVTKTGTAGVVGERKIIDADTDITNTTTWPQGKVDVSIPSMGRINNIAQAKKQCYDWKPGTEHVDANCWLWELPDSI